MPDSVKGMTVGGFEAELLTLAMDQETIRTKIMAFLEKSGIAYGWYCDWLNMWDIGSDNQIERLMELFRQAHPECENQRNKTKENK